VPELRLDQVHGQPVVRELGGVRVPEGVRMDALLDPGAAGEPLAEHAHVGGRYRVAPERAEDRRPPIDPPLRPDVEPPLHDGKRSGVEPDGAPLPALAAEHRHRAGGPVEVLRVQPQCLAHSQPAPVERHEQRAVADAGRGAVRARLDERSHLVGRQDLGREALPLVRGAPSTGARGSSVA